jgi:hypothetical protein
MAEVDNNSQKNLQASHWEEKRQKLLTDINQLNESLSPSDKLKTIKLKKSLTRCNTEIKRRQLHLKKHEKLPKKSAELVCRTTLYKRKVEEEKQELKSICKFCCDSKKNFNFIDKDNTICQGCSSKWWIRIKLKGSIWAGRISPAGQICKVVSIRDRPELGWHLMTCYNTHLGPEPECVAEYTGRRINRKLNRSANNTEFDDIVRRTNARELGFQHVLMGSDRTFLIIGGEMHEGAGMAAFASAPGPGETENCEWRMKDILGEKRMFLFTLPGIVLGPNRFLLVNYGPGYKIPGRVATTKLDRTGGHIVYVADKSQQSSLGIEVRVRDTTDANPSKKRR